MEWDWDYWTTQIRKTRKTQRDALTELARVRNDVERRMERIRTDDGLTTEGRRIAERKVRREARGRIAKAAARARKASDRVAQLRREHRKTNMGTSESRATLQRLLAEGMTIPQVFERARERGDFDLLAALRAEAPYFQAEGRWFEGDTFADTIDRAMAPLAAGKERDVLRTGLEAAADAELVEPAIEFAIQIADGTAKPGQDRLRYAYAEIASGGRIESSETRRGAADAG